jgi:hypothetical protein
MAGGPFERLEAKKCSPEAKKRRFLMRLLAILKYYRPPRVRCVVLKKYS